MRRILAAAAAAAILCVARLAAAADVTVFAAASLKGALDDQVRQFATAGGDRIVVAYAGSNALARQIEAGAPADLFISADLDWVQFLDARQLLDPASRVELLRNRLVLIAPADSPTTLHIGPGFPLAAALRGERLALANPDSVPAGKYAKAALQALGAWPAVEQRVARSENVRAALMLVARGEAALGIVYASDALAEPRVRVVGTFPEDTHPPIVYVAAVVAGRRSPGATALLAYLASAAARPTWQGHGFATVGQRVP